MLVRNLEICLAHRAPFGEAFFANVVQCLQTGQPIEPVQRLVDPKIILTLPGLMRALSRGWVRLRSFDSTVLPRDQRELWRRADGHRSDGDDGEDRAGHIGARRSPSGLQDLSPGPRVADDGQLRERVINNIGSYYHFVGWCKLGLDRLPVIDPRLKVHGVDRLRVADGSIMAVHPSGKTHTTTVMIGERAAEFIKAER